MRLFRDQGIDGPSLDAICAEAGYTRGAFYGHFSDRDDFLVAVMKEIGAPIVATLTLPTADQGDQGDQGDKGDMGVGSLATIAARFMASFADGSYPLAPQGGIRPHQLFAACARSPALREHYVALVGEATERLADAISADQQRGFLRTDIDAHALASGLLVLVVGGQSLAELDSPIDLGATTAALLAMLRTSSGGV